ncbi:MAG: polysaccharide biosynthesis C-terminal domain-containing protein [Candidatus Delongbacteria bacterium]|nr:polysaccharide biosynthesis C-terminal domain-containing protein [Candidatus Delongbacteria bacterium]
MLFGTSVITARALGPENLGYTKFLFLTLTTIAQFGSIGVIDATSYFQRKTKYDIETIFKVNFTFLLMAASLFIITILSLRMNGVIFEEYGISILLYTAVTVIFFNFISDLLVATMISREKIISMNNIFLVTGILNLIVLALLWKSGNLTVKAYMILFPLNSVVRTLTMLRYSKIMPGFNFRFGIIAEELKYGTIVFLGAFFIFLNYRLDQWLIKFFLGNKELGLYAVGVAIAEILLIIPTGLINPLRARLYNIGNDHSDFKTVTAKTIKFALYATAAISVPVFFLVPLISSEFLYGEKYAESVVIIQILIAGIIFLTFGKVGSHYYVVKGRPAIHMYSALSIFLVNFALNLIMIPKFGIKGAAIASSISYFAYGLIYVYLYLKVEKFPFADLFVLRRSEIRFYASKLKFGKMG